MLNNLMGVVVNGNGIDIEDILIPVLSIIGLFIIAIFYEICKNYER